MSKIKETGRVKKAQGFCSHPVRLVDPLYALPVSL
jgi:hypothetical protein